MLDEVESAQTPAAPGTDMVDEAIHVATGAGLFGSAGFLGAGALGARILTAVEGVADARLLTAVGGAADARLLQAAPPRRLTIIGSLWSFFFPTAGLSQAAVLMIAQLINFFVATKGVLDDSEGDRGKFWTAWLSGECLIYFGEIMLLVVFMLATPDFPYSVKALWKEDISAITLIIVSAMTILVLNSLWFYKTFWMIIGKIKDFKATALAYKEKAIQNWERFKEIYGVVKNRVVILCGDPSNPETSQKKKNEVKEEIRSEIKKSILDMCPWLETVQRMREQYAPDWLQDPEHESGKGMVGDTQMAIILLVFIVLIFLIFKILHHHATKALHHGLHHMAKHAAEYTKSAEEAEKAADAAEKAKKLKDFAKHEAAKHAKKLLLL